MPVSQEFLEAYKRLEEIRTEINKKTEAQLNTLLGSLGAQEIRIVLHDVTHRICAVEIRNSGGSVIRIQAHQGVGVQCLLEPPDPAIEALEEEWQRLNSRWRIFPH